jgi:hypothetical protein
MVGSEMLLLEIKDSSTTPMHCTALKVGALLGAISHPIDDLNASNDD